MVYWSMGIRLDDKLEYTRIRLEDILEYRDQVRWCTGLFKDQVDGILEYRNQVRWYTGVYRDQVR